MKFKRLIFKITPPDNWKVAVIVIAGIFSGLSIYAFRISKAASYLSDDPKTCINCHIMAPQYATWYHSAHREVAGCNDCHVPHNNAINKYFFKAKDGMRHATIFTLRAEPQVIFIKDESKEVVQMNCIRCHKNVISGPELIVKNIEFNCSINDRKCWECHRETPHGTVNSLSSVPYARVPLPESPVPDWLKDFGTDKK